MKTKVTRINEEDNIVGFVSMYLSSFQDEKDILTLNYNGELQIEEEDTSKIWFRRGGIKVTNGLIDFDSLDMNIENKKVAIEHLTDEFNSLKSAVYYFIGKKSTTISNPNNYQVNKIKTLFLAKKNGLMIPTTLITSLKTVLISFYESQDKNIITKGIQEICSIKLENDFKATYTALIDNEIMATLPDKFQPSLFQKNINKQYEIRTFYFRGKCYSMAIFSQVDSQTEIDFRRYNLKKPNRMVPYQLTKEVENKIVSLMYDLELDTGSIDFILGKDNKLYFLEINPVGQFSFLSQNCNYNLEKIIAEYIKNN